MFTTTTTTRNMSNSMTTKTSTATRTTTMRTTTPTALSHTRLWLLALQLMTLSGALPVPLQQNTDFGVAALPITSKPIEGTAENLAWQAWLMLPPEQKQLEKSRKVTPKSIFSLPFRDCPPGHQLYQSRCIPTVNINQSELLTQQLLGLIVGNDGAPGADNTYEFDYDDEELSVGGGEPLLMYGEQQRFNGAGDDNNNSNNNNSGNIGANSYAESGDVGGSGAQQPPNRDEPLKFNLFEQKYPTSDYEADNVAIEGSGGARPPPLPENLGSAIFNATQFLDAVQGLLQRHVVANVSLNATTSSNTNIDVNNNTNFFYNNSNGYEYTNKNNNSTSDNYNNSNNNTDLSDLQASSSNIGNNLATTLATGIAPPTFAFGDIDAIVLPAVASPPAKVSESTSTIQSAAAAATANLEPQRFSLFKDDSAVQLVTTVIGHKQRQSEPQIAPATATDTQPDNIAQMLRDDALLPLAQAQVEAESQANIPWATTTGRTALPAALALSGGGSDSTWVDTTIPTSFALSSQAESINEDYEATEPTTMPNSAATTTARAEKDERPRSVTQRNVAAGAADTEAQEVSFTTTAEPESTTNFQIDETTVIETAEMQSDALDDTQLLEAILQAQAKQQLSESGENEQERRVLKKSKVEPVEQATTNTIASTTTETQTEIKTTTPAIATNTTMNTKIETETETETATKKLAETQTTKTTTTTTAKATATPLPSALTATTATATIANKAIGEASTDRFRSAATAIADASAVANGNQVVVAAANLNDVQRSGSNLVNVHDNNDTNSNSDTNNDNKNGKKNINNIKNFNKNKDVDSNKSMASKTATAATSEINIEQELRMINELVKGKQQLAALKTTTTTTKDSTTMATTATPTTPTIAATTTDIASTKIESRRSIAEVGAGQSVVYDSDGNSGSGRISIAKETTKTTPRASDIISTTATTAATIQTEAKEHITTTPTTKQNNENGGVMAAATSTKTENNEAMTTTTTPNSYTDSSTTPSMTTTTTTSSDIPTTEISQRPLWTRFVPFLGFGKATTIPTPTTITTTTATPSVTIETFNPFHPASSSKTSISTDSGGASNNLSNRSNRNSKIIRINHLSDNGVVAVDGEAITFATTTIRTTTTTDEQVEQPAPDPFWWLPTGWRLDREANDEQHLLLRLWSAFPESQLKAKVNT